jgi:hypothetical protein
MPIWLTSEMVPPSSATIRCAPAQSRATKAFGDIRRAITALENAWHLGSRDAHTPVRHPDNSPAVHRLDAHYYWTVVTVVLEGVVDQIGEHAFHASRAPPPHQIRYRRQHHDAGSTQSGGVTLIGDAFDKMDQIDHLPVAVSPFCARQWGKVCQFLEQVSDARCGLLYPT